MRWRREKSKTLNTLTEVTQSLLFWSWLYRFISSIKLFSVLARFIHVRRRIVAMGYPALPLFPTPICRRVVALNLDARGKKTPTTQKGMAKNGGGVGAGISVIWWEVAEGHGWLLASMISIATLRRPNNQHCHAE
jgi:hypothetical protein